MLNSPEQTARAEGALLGGVHSGHWQASGLALVAQRLDAVIERLDALAGILTAGRHQ